jgi:hypothetical protein
MSPLGRESGCPYLGPRPRGSGKGAVRRGGGGGGLGEVPRQRQRKRRGALGEGPGEEVGVRRGGEAGCDGAPPRHGFALLLALRSRRGRERCRCGARAWRERIEGMVMATDTQRGVQPQRRVPISPLTRGPIRSPRLRPQAVAGLGPHRLVHRAHARRTPNPHRFPLGLSRRASFSSPEKSAATGGEGDGAGVFLPLHPILLQP